MDHEWRKDLLMMNITEPKSGPLEKTKVSNVATLLHRLPSQQTRLKSTRLIENETVEIDRGPLHDGPNTCKNGRGK